MVLKEADGAAGEDAVQAWSDSNKNAIARSRSLIEDFQQSGGLDIAKLALANRVVRRVISG